MHRPHPSPTAGGRRVVNFSSLFAAVVLSTLSLTYLAVGFYGKQGGQSNVPINAAEIVQKCRMLDVLPSPPKDFNSRVTSDRFVPGTPPILFKNATIWTGRVSGREVLKGDLLLDGGLIKGVGHVRQSLLATYKNLQTVHADGAWISPGIVDLHSHIGVDSAPALRGSADTNSLKGLVLPWLRSLDGLNTHDDAYMLSMSGGVTTVNVLPGSADAIGGQAFTIKLRPTAERSPSSMLLEAPFSLNGTNVDPSIPPRWRQMKHACGENPSRVYSGTRMDTIWAFRQGYNEARKIKQKQDEYCSNALAGNWNGLGEFPENLQWEALVDVLRGRVKVHNHCYEAVDLDGMVRLTNEFKFSIAAFHHAHETYLVPDLLKKAYGHPPAIAIFATNARYKREAYRGSEFAARILSDNGLDVVMKSDHPVLNSRHLLHEAQQAHYYGLPENLSLGSVTSTPARVLGMDHRIGYVKIGYDADVVLWDSHPLSIGATPKQVYIDGIAQLKKPHSNPKPEVLRHAPATPNFDKEVAETLKYDGLPPLAPKDSLNDAVIFSNVSSVFVKSGYEVQEVFSSAKLHEAGAAIVKNGVIVCIGTMLACPEPFEAVKKVDLQGGSIFPSLISYGSPLGLSHIEGEASTNDGPVFDPLAGDSPRILGQGSAIRAVDGLQFSSRDALLAYRSGVTMGITAPYSGGFLSGLSTAFGTGLPHKLADGAVIQEVTALHFSIGASVPSVSTQIATLRTLLSGKGKGELAKHMDDVLHGQLPIIIDVQSADIMASLIQLKKEAEARVGSKLRMVFAGANEAHLLANEIGQSGIGVILTPVRPFPATWKSKRILPGPPLTRETSVTLLHANNVTVGVGVEEKWSSRNLRFDIAWAYLDASGRISKAEAISLASSNLEQLLGIKKPNTDLIAIEGGGLLGVGGKVAGIISPLRGKVDLL